MLVRGQPRVLPGVYVPSCDQDGFYLPRQCRTTDKNGNKECWCVDRNGSKIEGLTECGKVILTYESVKSKYNFSFCCTVDCELLYF